VTSRLLRLAFAAALLLALAAVGCGEDSDSGDTGMPPPPARAEDFPKAEGRTLDQLRREVGDEGPILLASVSELSPGANRFGFGLFDRARGKRSPG